MQNAKKKFLLTIVTLYQFIATAQCNTTIKNIPLSLKIVALCEKITALENNPLLLIKCFFTDSLTTQKDGNIIHQYKADTLYFFDKRIGQSFEISRFYDSLDKSKYCYQIYIELHSIYELENITKKIQYDTTNNTNISYQELNVYLGKPIANFPPNFQGIDSKSYSYIYTNPITYKKAFVQISSFDPPSSTYNIMFSIFISNEAIGIKPDPTPLKFNKDYLQKKKKH